MPPRRLVNRQQLDIMLDFLEQNKDVMLRGLPAPGTLMPGDMDAARSKWCHLARMLNAVENGHTHTPVGWRKYWSAYSHKIKTKAENCRLIETGQSSDKYTPLTEVELRVLSLTPGNVPKVNKKPSSPNSTKTAPVAIRPKNVEEVTLQPLPLVYVVQAGPKPPVKMKQQTFKRKKLESNSEIEAEYFAENNQVKMEATREGSITPPPQWALDMEERRIAAQERTATALETIAAIMTAQEERRTILDERIAEAVTSIAGTVQELNTRIQETLQHLNPVHLEESGPDIKDHSYL